MQRSREAQDISRPRQTTQHSTSKVRESTTYHPLWHKSVIDGLISDSTIESGQGALAHVEERSSTNIKLTKAPLRSRHIEPQPCDFLMKSDVEAWRRWREEHPKLRPDLSRADLRGLDLRRFDLHDVNLADANLSETKLNRVNLRGAILTRADLSGAKLNEANLQEADLNDADLKGTKLRGADMSKAQLKQANLSKADLSEATLQDVDLTKAKPKKAKLNQADLTGAMLADANLRGALARGARFSGAILTKADLSRADLTDASLPDANLGEAILRETHLDGAILTKANLSGAYLIEAILPEANMNNADLEGATLRGADMSKAQMKQANLSKADLSEAMLYDVDLTQAVQKKANLARADLTEANLSDANFGGAILKEATFKETRLEGTNLSKATLNEAVFEEADLRGTTFVGASLYRTFFLNVDLSESKGLETVDHQGSSIIDLDSIVRSQRNMPEIFLRRAGVPDIIIDSMLSQVDHPIKYHSCFISYSSKDEVFAKKLYIDLRRLGVLCSFAPEDLKIGEVFYNRICDSIRGNDKLLLILSENSIKSSWVQKEVGIASQKEGEDEPSVLFPIQLDNAAETTDQDWAANIRSRLHIGDFTRWQQPDTYQLALAHLLQSLKVDS